jgi:signal transduction histidine kinase
MSIWKYHKCNFYIPKSKIYKF